MCLHRAAPHQHMVGPQFLWSLCSPAHQIPVPPGLHPRMRQATPCTCCDSPTDVVPQWGGAQAQGSLQGRPPLTGAASRSCARSWRTCHAPLYRHRVHVRQRRQAARAKIGAAAAAHCLMVRKSHSAERILRPNPASRRFLWLSMAGSAVAEEEDAAPGEDAGLSGVRGKPCSAKAIPLRHPQGAYPGCTQVLLQPFVPSLPR